MDRHTPPSPAPTKAEPLPTGFNELMQHNAAPSYARETMPPDTIQVHSQPASRYGTPVPQQQQPNGFDTSMYHQQAVFQYDNSPYGPIPEPYNTPATSPPTPSRASDMMSIRSGNVSRSDVGSKVLGPRSSRVEKSTPKKKKKERAKPAKNMPVLDKPMSELTKNSSIVVADIETYVHRSSEVRRQEVETGKNPGRVKRPMNAFMLYRKAYQQRAKEWASQHNHQVVSRVCGLSWPLEPEHIRQQFKTWADIERDNHQKAHPNYKFTPSKPLKTPKFEPSFDDHSDASDLEDYDWGRGGSRMRSGTNTPHDDSEYIPSRSVYAATHPYPHPHQIPGMHGLGMLHQGRSALDFNQGKPIGSPYDHRDLPGQHYETLIHHQPQRHLHHSVVEDVMISTTPSPSMAFQPQGHPDPHSHYELSQYQARASRIEQRSQSQSQHQQYQHQHPHQQHTHASPFEHRIDPSLMPADEALFDPGNFNSMSNMYDGGLGGPQHSWQTNQLAAGNEAESQFSHAFLGLDETLSLEQHTQYLRGADEWQIEPLAETAQFDTSWVEPKSEP